MFDNRYMNALTNAVKVGISAGKVSIVAADAWRCVAIVHVIDGFDGENVVYFVNFGEHSNGSMYIRNCTIPVMGMEGARKMFASYVS